MRAVSEEDAIPLRPAPPRSRLIHSPVRYLMYSYRCVKSPGKCLVLREGMAMFAVKFIARVTLGRYDHG